MAWVSDIWQGMRHVLHLQGVADGLYTPLTERRTLEALSCDYFLSSNQFALSCLAMPSCVLCCTCCFAECYAVYIAQFKTLAFYASAV